MVRASLLALAALASAIYGQAFAAETPQTWPAQIHEDLIRLGEVEWKLRRSTADQCPATASTAAIVIDYIDAYDEGDRAYVRQETGLGDLPQVLSVSADGPAASAGIRAGDEIVAIDDVTVRALLDSGGDPALLADQIQDLLAALAPGRKATVTVLRGGNELSAEVTLAKACAARFILKTEDAIEAYSDGENIAVTTGTIRFTENDHELALVTGHELAHVIADGGKPAGLFGRRKMEDEADLLGAQLAFCAGYDVKRSLGFWERFAKREKLGWLPSPTHRSASARHRQLDAAAQTLTCAKRR